MGAMGHPRLVQTVLDCTDARALAEFYRELLGYEYADQLIADRSSDVPREIDLSDLR
jgi:hypothetical protein